MNPGAAVLLAARTNGVREAEVDDATVLWHPTDRRLHSLNTTAAAIWRLVPRAQTLGELTALVADDFGAQPRMIRADVVRVVDDLRSKGLLGGNGLVASGSPVTRAPHVDPTEVTIRIRALGAEVAVVIDEPMLAAAIEADLAPLLDDRNVAAAANTIVAVTTDDGMVDLYVNGADAVRLGSPLAALTRVVAEVNALAVASVPDHLVLHAGAVARDGCAVLLPADSNSGKSTLTTALVAGGWHYLTDEAAAVDDELIVQPYAKSIALDPGSFPIFPQLAPQSSRSGLQSALQARAWYVDPSDVGTVAGATPAHIIVSPRWSKGAETSVSVLTPLEALHALLGFSFDFDIGGHPVFEILALLANRVPMYRLTYSDLGEAAAIVDRLAG